jgi:hypothetical protein
MSKPVSYGIAFCRCAVVFPPAVGLAGICAVAALIRGEAHAAANIATLAATCCALGMLLWIAGLLWL